MRRLLRWLAFLILKLTQGDDPVIIKLLIIPAAEISYVVGFTANDEFTGSAIVPRVIQAGPYTGDGAVSLNVLIDPDFAALQTYLLSKTQADIDTDVAWPPIDE